VENKMSLNELIFVTGNPNKAREVAQILNFPVSQVSLDLPEIQSDLVEEVVKAKAKAAFAILGKKVLVEDTSLIFTSLNNLPGPLIKWFVKNVGMDGLIKLAHLGKSTQARAIACFGLYDGQGEVMTFMGEVEGKIADQPMGEDGFGWDPIFIPKGFTKTFAQMSDAEKNTCSMRALAFQEFKTWLH